MRLPPEIHAIFDNILNHGKTEEMLIIPPIEKVCLLEMTIEIYKSGKIELLTGKGENVTIDAGDHQIYWNGDPVKKTHVIRDNLQLQLIISKPFAELFIDDQTTFSFPLEDGLNCNWRFYAYGKEIRWILKSFNGKE